MAKADAEKPSKAQGIMNFFPESWAELKKVHTPTRQETILMTVRVFGMIAFFAFFLGITDMLVGKVMQIVFAR